MNFHLFGLLLAAYLIGSFPTAYVYCRLRGKDVRKEGSGNVGATNAGRLFGRSAFITVFALDFLKGWFPITFLVPRFAPPDMLPLWSVVTLCMVVIGHVWTLFLDFRGGKGVATSLGAIMGILPWPGLGTVLVFVVVFFLRRIVSLASILAALVFPLLVLLASGPGLYFGLSLGLALFIVYTHRSNITRLLKGEEKAFRSGSGKRG